MQMKLSFWRVIQKQSRSWAPSRIHPSISLVSVPYVVLHSQHSPSHALLHADHSQVAQFIFDKYIKVGSPRYVAMTGTLADDIRIKIGSEEVTPQLFDAAQAHLLRVLCTSVLPHYPGMLHTS